jgi:hypothetical protein
MQLPADLLRTRVAVISSGTANTVTTGSLVAAPAAGIRLRLWGFGAYPTSTAQAVVNWRAAVAFGVAGVKVIGLSGANFAAPGPIWLPGGITPAAATALGWEVSSALISMVLELVAYTTQEPA